MQTAETLSVARDAARMLDEGGNVGQVRVTGLSGASGGREDNPTMFYGHAVRYTDESRGVCIMLWPGDELREVERASFVVDGVGMFVAGFRTSALKPFERATDGYVLLHPMYERQVLLPRRAYVLNSSMIPALKGAAY
jgi:hypothetical protein